MKRLGAVLLMLGMSLALNAQRPIYLFKEFTQGSVALKNRTFVKTTFNYDTLHDKLLYMDGDQIMELSDYSDVQSVFIGERMFIPQGKSLYEVVDLGESPSKLLIRWHQKTYRLNFRARGSCLSPLGSFSVTLPSLTVAFTFLPLLRMVTFPPLGRLPHQ